MSSRPGRVGGKVAIVTGAGSRGPGIGTGRASAVLLAREGARVALVDREPAAAAETLRMIEDEGGAAMVVEADVTDRGSCAAAVERTVSAWGSVDILVNNVGVSGPRGTATELDSEAWEAIMRVNLTAMMLMAGQVTPVMASGRGGSIVNMASTAGLMGGSPLLVYSVSKAGVIGLTRSLAFQHGADGIRVNAVAPGYIQTPMAMAGVGGDDPALWERRRQQTLLRTLGTAWDVGYAVLYLASDEARWVTGVVLPVDAGLSAGQERPV
jgi:NAD(P)-dependent dehydrogenase (short-subunit alcohol dehydrogenase family)